MNFKVFLLFVFFSLSREANARKKTISESDIEAKLKLLNKPAVKSIQSEDGDIIDCVDIHKQPAFDHPALKNHVIQMKPSFEAIDPTQSTSNQTRMIQPWQKSGSCPNGTVPIRRIKKQDLLRADSLEEFGRKPSYNTSTLQPETILINNTELNIYPIPNRSTAFLATLGHSYIGGKGSINLWSPKVDLPDDFTTAQIWLKAGPENNFESIEAGWTVNPKLYGDRLPHLFAYWTGDAYQKTGCFDLTCGGFVQTSSKIVLGSIFTHWSTYGGDQWQINVEINIVGYIVQNDIVWDDLTTRLANNKRTTSSWDGQTSNWWLRVMEEDVGYWPAASFLPNLNHSSTLVQWGGDVYSQNVKKTPHTKTAMGSGRMSTTLWGNVCFIQNVRIRDYTPSYKYPDWVGTWSEEPDCYSCVNLVGDKAEPEPEPIFYFGGGPGGIHSPYCP